MSDRAIYTTDSGRARHTTRDCSHFYQADTMEPSGRVVPKSKVRLATPEEMRSKRPCRDCAYGRASVGTGG
jgi:hypothetical protein